MDAESRKRRLLDWVLPKLHTEPALVRAGLYRSLADMVTAEERSQLIELADKLEQIERESLTFEFFRNPTTKGNQP
jgi:hypothetical protein